MVVSAVLALFLAHPQPVLHKRPAKTFAEVAALFSKFIHQPGTLEVSLKIHLGDQSKYHSGSATMALIPSHRRPSPQKWDILLGPYDYHYVTDSTNALEWSHAEGKYDRHAAFAGFPLGRISAVGVLAYPYGIASGDLGGFFQHGGTLAETTASHYLLTFDKKTQEGEIHIKAILALDGRITEYDVESSKMGQKSTINTTFSNYRFTNEKPDFDTKPKPGYTYSQLPDSIEVLVADSPMPSVPLTGASRTNLAKLTASGLVLTVFTEAPLDSSLEKTLQSLSGTAKAYVISTQAISSQLPVYLTSQAGFDTAGIAVTPQFYLTRDGKVVQAWQGWDPNLADQFVNEIKTAIKG